MKISRTWLQTYFEHPLPDVEALSEALTFHAFEIESVEHVGLTKSHMDGVEKYGSQTAVFEILDVKVTPNRGHDCLSHRGIAKEVSAILNLPIKVESKTKALQALADGEVAVSINTPLCARYIAGLIRGVKVGPSPEWLKKSLESMGQRSINNIVDATNYVMFGLGQPLHAFDAGKLSKKDGKYAIAVRPAREGETMMALDDKEYALKENNLVIVDTHANVAIGIAGVKGGKPSGVDESTTDIILESANFDGVSVRKTAHTLKLRTDASQRFEQGISSELAAEGARVAADLITQIAGGEIVGFTDAYPIKQEQKTVSVSVDQINCILGTTFTGADVATVFVRLGFAYKEENGVFDVIPPTERLDILIAEDLAEEVGRIIGFDKVVAEELPPFAKKPEINANFYAAEKIREDLMSQGYSEVYTSVFADTGERAVANKVESVRPYLRANLTDGLQSALEKNTRNKELLGLKEVKLFEIGTVWREGKEMVMVGTVSEKEKTTEIPLQNSSENLEVRVYDQVAVSEAVRFEPFSRYPFIVRDIAMWTEKETDPKDALKILRAQSGDLLVRSELFDRFEKGEKLSLAFRLVFQSFEKTLTDEEVNAVMEKVYTAVAEKGWQVR